MTCTCEYCDYHRKKEATPVVNGPVPEFKRNFEVGKTYLRKDGKAVKILEVRNENMRDYCMVRGDDLQDFIVDGDWYPENRGWRYDKSGLMGGYSFTEELDGPRNLVPGAIDDVC